MKIVNRTAFLALPSGTVYAKYEAQFFGDLAIKGDSLGEIDFYYCDLCQPWFEGDHGSDTHFEILNQIEAGAAVAVDYNVESRDGLFDQTQLFAVLSADDVQRLITRLGMTLK